MQQLVDKLSKASQAFSLTISLRTTNVLGEGAKHAQTITINNYKIKVVHEFTYFVSAISDDLSLGLEISRRIGRASLLTTAVLCVWLIF